MLLRNQDGSIEMIQLNDELYSMGWDDNIKS